MLVFKGEKSSSKKNKKKTAATTLISYSWSSSKIFHSSLEPSVLALVPPSLFMHKGSRLVIESNESLRQFKNTMLRVGRMDEHDF